ncbi:cytochrome b/b6 domain-containing protein [Achromobacter seleniivolatilans]|uniref:Cytochrome b/b6 domain-containing protein n=1 Tax=Achromobacter seleniivolatilans TaxID=3047478 RepID=A0ABY9LU50_9BURK|nr:cytochrome b/b6 domain-containing protein [Achromobacter sp. R39]WMD18306.1 cytochrome b/b6 domain-containing protein [Achromobacter sp. R39]
MNPASAAPASPAYTRSQIALHWLSASLMIALILAGELRHLITAYTALSMRAVMIAHIACGMALLAVTLIRAGVRIAQRRAPGATRCVQDTCAHAVHLAIYGFVLAECLIGWIIVNAKGLAVPVPFTTLEFPRLVSENSGTVAASVLAHDVLGWLLYGLLALHVAAALWHHLVVRDGTLARMGWRRRPEQTRTTHPASVDQPSRGLAS